MHEKTNHICVYHNTTGSWEPAESRKMDISLEDFFGWEPETEALPLIPFSGVAGTAPERPLVVRMTFPGDLPAYGVSYVDAQEDVHHLLLDISGKDGSLMLREEPDFWDFVPK